jgi:KUP system potassium uptake protein
VALSTKRGKAVLIGLGIFGASLFYGDGMITPAISVLSAVEGLRVVDPGFEDLVVPITLVIIVVLFAIQRFGTGAVGKLFGPVMALWFGTLGVAGLVEALHEPAILKALSPSYGFRFFLDHFHIAFIALGAVVLTVTGAEALYADMGHFGRPPIRRAWFLFVFPALTLNYLGQGALILRSPDATDSPFFRLFPDWLLIPIVALATLATVIASQAVISGAFSVTRQAVSLGFLPRVTIRHTSEEEVGQVYAPLVNWGIFAAVVALVVGFRSSERLASAYGIAVTGTLAIDTLLFFVVVRTLFKRRLRVVIPGLVLFLGVDLTFFAGNVSKIPKGGWFPLTIAAVIFTVLMTWQRGRDLVTQNRTELEGDLRTFLRKLRGRRDVVRVEGTAVFLHPNNDTTPLAMRNLVKYNHALHESVVVLSIDIARVPHVPEADRLDIDELGYADDGITHVRATYGFQDVVDVPHVLRLCTANGGLERPIDVDEATFFLSRMRVIPGERHGMLRWRKRLFIFMSRNASDATEYFRLPQDSVVSVGSHVEV